MKPKMYHTSWDGRLHRIFHSIVSKKRHSRKFPKLPTTIEPDHNRFGIAIAIIVKNEARFMGEWIAFHCMLGVRHVYVYDNMSEDDLQGAIEQSGYGSRVTIIPWGRVHLRQQNLAYNHCVASFGAQYRWMGFLDADEFVFPLHSQSLVETFERFEDQPCVALPWHMFGTSGHNKSPDGFVIENFTLREQFPPEGNAKVVWKIFADPCKVKRAGIHSADLVGFGDVNFTQTGLMFDRYCRRDLELCKCEHLKLHHYYTRSKADFETKIRKGSVATAGTKDRTAILRRRFKQIEQNPIEDLDAVRFVESLKRSKINSPSARPAE